jgi:hypothetical protein
MKNCSLGTSWVQSQHPYFLLIRYAKDWGKNFLVKYQSMNGFSVGGEAGVASGEWWADLQNTGKQEVEQSLEIVVTLEVEVEDGRLEKRLLNARFQSI